MSQISLQADETYMDERLDKFLSAMLPDQSRSYLQKIIKDGNVLVNGEPKKSSYRLEDGDEVTADLPELKSPDIEPENIPLDILYEDDSILMVNKPKGMVVPHSQDIIQVHWSMQCSGTVRDSCQGSMEYPGQESFTGSTRIPPVYLWYVKMMQRIMRWQRS